MEETKKPTNYSEIQKHIDVLGYLGLVEKNSSYSCLCKNLLENFGIKVSLSEIQELYEPSIEELKTDLEIQYNNVH